VHPTASVVEVALRNPSADAVAVPPPTDGALAGLHAAAVARAQRHHRRDVDYPVEHLPAAVFYALPGPFWCDTCQATVSGVERTEHDVGTLHLFHRSSALGPPAMRKVQLPDRNVGFAMLAKMGFDETDGGLGASRQGRLEPIATALKMDRSGLGHAPLSSEVISPQSRALAALPRTVDSSGRLIKRVTHFPSHAAHEEALTVADGGSGSTAPVAASAAKRTQDALGRGAGGGVKRKARPNRRGLEERLEARRCAAIRRELSGSAPEGFEEYFT